MQRLCISRAQERQIWRISNEIKVSERLGENKKGLRHFIALLWREQRNFCIILIIEAREHKAPYF